MPDTKPQECTLDLRTMGRPGLALLGGVLGGTIALVGYAVLAPDVESLARFLALRILVGATVAGLVAPHILRFTSD